MKKKVLVVEDEAITALCLKLDLEKAGVEVLELVSTGEKAIIVASEKSPSLILMDIRLAGDMDGIEASEKIIDQQPNIPIAFMTGYTTEFIKERALSLKPVNFLEKPLRFEQIKMILDNL